MFNKIAKATLRSLGYELRKINGNNVQYFRDQPRDPFFHKQMFLRECDKVTTIIDAGSHIGDTVARYRSLFPEATVYSFEPTPSSYKAIVRRFEGDNLVKPYQMALSNTSGAMTFHLKDGSDSNSLFLTAKYGKRYNPLKAQEVAKVIEVPVTTIDSFCKEEGIQEIHILKMDVESAELLVLEAATEKLQKHLIDLVYLEATFIPHNEGEPLFHHVSEFLSRYQYTLFDFYNIIRARDGQLRRADALFVSPQIREQVINHLDPEP